ncbi:MAG: hypothetical protein AAEJ52_03415 [Myxococcota bacterium]
MSNPAAGITRVTNTRDFVVSDISPFQFALVVLLRRVEMGSGLFEEAFSMMTSS